ncbi:hypothetical protein Q6240_30870, partial [Klebsiella pneumoniae]|nr:hypothetical protein [Klebsiella pneumoniae]
MGSQGGISTLANANRREVGTLNISPLWRANLGSLARLDLRGNFTRTEVRGSSLGDSRGTGGSLRLSGLGGG